jgi:hypothetical protein
VSVGKASREARSPRTLEVDHTCAKRHEVRMLRITMVTMTASRVRTGPYQQKARMMVGARMGTKKRPPSIQSPPEVSTKRV